MAAPALTVSPRDALVDEPVRIAAVRVLPDASVTLRLAMADGAGRHWVSWASFAADARGTVDVAARAPVAGTYAGADAMGLFWSAQPAEAAPDRAPFALTGVEPIVGELTAEVHGARVARAALVRRFVAPGVARVPLRERGLVGTLFVPPGAGPHPCALWLGGSSGGLREHEAALLASHGIACLALAYFGADGLPASLVRIPLEYFEAALAWLAARPGLRGELVGVVGRSRGAELALLLGSRLREVGPVVAYAPSGVLWGGVNSPEPAWTYRGVALPQMPDATTPEQQVAVEASDPLVAAPFYQVNLDNPSAPPEAAIPVERMRGPALLISGEDDAMWPSRRMGDDVRERMASHGRQRDVTHLRYPDAGHLIGFPHLPTTVSERRHPVVGIRFAYGGTPAGNAKANADSWPRGLAFLRDTL